MSWVGDGFDGCTNLVMDAKVLIFPLFLEFEGRKPPWLLVCGVRSKGVVSWMESIMRFFLVCFFGCDWPIFRGKRVCLFVACYTKIYV